MKEKRLNILLIDDDEMIRNLALDYFTSAGYTVTAARDGDEGIRVFKSGAFDAVIADLNMPVKDGFQVLEYMRENYPVIPIIVISGTGDIREMAEALRLGAWDYIMKPLSNIEILSHSIQKSVEKANLIVQNMEYRLYLEDKIDRRTEELQTTNSRLRDEILRSRESDEKLRMANMELNTMIEEMEAMNEELITSQKELETSEKKYRLLADNVTDNIWILDVGTLTFTYISPSIKKLIGYSAEEMTGEPLKKMVTTGSHQRIMEILKIQLLENEKKPSLSPVTLELEMIQKGGAVVWVEVTASFLRGKRREITGILGVSRDITERKRAEEEIKLTLKEKETLLKEIHHRVKNNMQVISSILNLQCDYIDNSRDRDLVLDCQRRVHSMALIHEKLYQSNSLSAVNFSEYVNGLVKELLAVYPGMSERINFRIDITDMFIGVDFAIPCALLLNELLTNTMKYAFPGDSAGTVAISFSGDKAGSTLVYRDDGAGIPAVVDIRKPATMGLELVNLITRQLNGVFTVDSSTGTAYRFEFHAGPQKGAPAVVDLTLPARSTPWKKILIVEDDLITATLIKKIIEGQDYRVVGIADSSESALEYMEKAAPDLVLMDIILKDGADGIETVKMIREGSNVPVIFSTANTDPVIRKRAGETSPFGYIKKPINKTELLHMIHRALH